MAGQDRGADERTVIYKLDDPFNKCGGSRVLSPQEAAALRLADKITPAGQRCKPGLTVFVLTGR